MNPSAPSSTLGKFLRNAIRFLLIVAALVGMWKATKSSLKLRQLEAEYQELVEEVGYLKVDDPNKVYIIALPSKEKFVWRFRVYLPANYKFSEYHYMGRISAKSFRYKYASGGSSTGIAVSEPSEFLMTVALLKEGDRWSVHANGRNSRRQGSLDPKIAELLESDGQIVIESVAKEGPQSFAADEPICPLRIRTVEPVDDKDTEDPLYLGFFHYIVPKDARPSFEDINQ